MSEIALLGNPNTGKTSLFNNLTGSYEYVGNWSGVTVEKKIGYMRGENGIVIDLPGIYSLNPISEDESVVTRFLLHDPCSKILNIIDASQLERNLHLTLQLLEYGKPMIIGLNMTDVAAKRGLKINDTCLSKQLGMTVVPIIARTGSGCKELATNLSLLTEIENKPAFIIDYGDVIEWGIKKFSRIYEEYHETRELTLTYPLRWLAVQFFEGNTTVHKFFEEQPLMKELQQLLKEVSEDVEQETGVSEISLIIFQKRKAVIDQISKQVTEQTYYVDKTLTERIDQVMTHPILGVPIFLLCMYMMFMLTFNWLGFPLSNGLDAFFSGYVTEWVISLLSVLGASAFITSLIVDGIIAGVGGVLVFVPQIFILFFFISILEDSGYMARVALVMDRLMEKIGLNGKAFIPMIIGFGCNVPGVMAARTIEQPKERLLTMLLTPLMSCSARLPVYALLVGTFFVQYQAITVLSLYVIGIVTALFLAKIFTSTLLKGEKSIFIIELPPYRMPQLQALVRSTWDKGKGFLRKAGTFIFAGSVMIWFLSYMGPSGLNVAMDESFLAMIGGVIAPLLTPIGFGTWQAGAALLTGFLAKEVIVSSMNIIYHIADVNSLQGIITKEFTSLSAFTFMVFILLYVPCLATVATIKKESGSKKWTFFSIGYSITIAYSLTFCIYQIGRLLGF